MVQSLWTTVQLFLKKLNIELPYHPTIPLLGVKPKELEADLKQRFVPWCS